jgi:dTDP-4-dehydrorhamnose 3,5-epimerase
MDFEKLEIDGVVLITPKRIADPRGYFVETFSVRLFQQHIGSVDFVQDNQSLSVNVGTIRGLHFQLEPMAQGKLVRCVAGSLIDYAVDIRRASPTYGKHISVELTEDNGKQLWIPPGFAHGFCTTSPMTAISYKVTNYYSAEHDRGLLWNDPTLEIPWPFSAEEATLSDKDKRQPRLTELHDSI